MARPTFRHAPTLESLERREVLSGPSADAQYMLELVNLARTNPAAAAEKVTSNLDANDQATLDYYHVDLNQEKQAIASFSARQPLAWSDALANAAWGQSQDQANSGVQSHTGSDGSNLSTRLNRVGLTNLISNGENAFAYSQSIDESMKAFLLDWGVSDKGHRRNLLQPDASSSTSYNEVGIGIVHTNNKGLGPLVVTQDFARSAAKPYLLGVVFNDPSHANFYAPGQGQSGINIEAKNLSTGQVTSAQTWDAGGYQMNLDSGNYQVTAKQGSRVIHSQQVNIGSDNVKVDFDLSNPWDASAPVTAPPVQIRAAAVAPQVAPVQQPVAVSPTPAAEIVKTVPPVVIATPVPEVVIATPTTSNATTTRNNTSKSANPSSGAALTASLFNPLGWITSWSSWKATNAS